MRSSPSPYPNQARYRSLARSSWTPDFCLFPIAGTGQNPYRNRHKLRQ
jgi:hypothetical protein